MKQQVMNDPDTKDIDVSNIHNLSKAFQFLQLRDVEKDGYYPVLIKDPYLEIIYVPTLEKSQQIKRNKSVKCFGEDSRDIKASLKDFRTNTAKRKKAYKIASDIVSGKISHGLYIKSSMFQIGKTYLANAITNALVDKGYQGSFLFTPSFARQAKEFDSLENRIRMLNESQLLVIDDIGAEYDSKWFRTEVLMPVLQYRLANNQLTIFTSNYSIEKLRDLYKKSGSEIDTNRLITRILELTEEVEIDDA